MPRPSQAKKKAKAPPKAPFGQQTIEVDGFLHGLHHEFAEQVKRYLSLTNELAQIEGRIEIAEKNLRVTRDHMKMTLEQAKDSTVPPDWGSTFKLVEFVGMRLADACVVILRKEKRISHEDLMRKLNKGMFRFRSSAPLREINATLMRHPSIERNGTDWVWTGKADQAHLRFGLQASEPRLVVQAVDTAPDQIDEVEPAEGSEAAS